jgi:glycosyltransferase involved in cell wall biosynthesis
MEMADLDVSLTSPIPWIGDPDPDVFAEVGHLAKRPAKWDIYIFSSPFTSPTVMERPLKILIRGAKPPRVMYTMIERRSIAPESAQLVSQLDGVWLPCRANVEAFNRSGVPTNKTGYMPFPFFNDDPNAAIFGTNRAPGVPRFLWDGNWEPRKAPDNLVRAFMRAFKPGEARLTMKIGLLPLPAAGFPMGPEVVVVDEIQQNSDVAAKGWTSNNYSDSIRIVRGQLREMEMVKLRADHDIYVSCSRGEGIDLPVFKAKLAGRRVVATYSGGPEEFLGTKDVRVAATGVAPVHSMYQLESGAEYGDYSVDDLAAALAKAAEGPLVSKERDWPIENFRARAVGIKLRRLVEKTIDDTRRR